VSETVVTETVVTELAVTELALLAAWEDGYGRPAPDRAIALAALSSGLPAGKVADLSLGQCDLLLLRLREESFGPRLDALAECPACGTDLDVGVEISELICVTPPASCLPFTRTIEVTGREVTVRPVTVSDLQASGGDRARLLVRCVTADPVSGATADPVAESGGPVAEPALLDAIEAELDILDPQAATGIDLGCPECGASWHAVVDVTEFVWSEVDWFARRLLFDVHTLASAYGWTEADVLAVSPARRRFYLQACAP